jgi:hypothetical protein
MKNHIIPITTTILNSNICIENSLNNIDPTQIEFLLGYRKDQLTIINPVKVLYSLKNFLRFLRELSLTSTTFCFIIDVSNIELYERFKFFCIKKGILFVDARENFISFYDKLYSKPNVVIALFLEDHLLAHLYKKTIYEHIPVVGIRRLSSNFFSTNSQILGNFEINSLAQNFIISMIILAFQH